MIFNVQVTSFYMDWYIFGNLYEQTYIHTYIYIYIYIHLGALLIHVKELQTRRCISMWCVERIGCWA